LLPRWLQARFYNAYWSGFQVPSHALAYHVRCHAANVQKKKALKQCIVATTLAGGGCSQRIALEIENKSNR